jgi:hypothetical protein
VPPRYPEEAPVLQSGLFFASGPEWHTPVMSKGPYARRPTAEETERELYTLFDQIEAKLRTLPPVKWQALTVTRTEAGFEVRVTL